MLFGAAGDPNVRYPDGMEIAPQLDLREHFQLFAGVRPLRLLPGARSPLADPRAADIDLVLIREQTEGLFSARGIDDSNAQQATDVMTITRAGAERLFDFGFGLARRRKAAGKPGRLTCVDKANVLASMAYFRAIFDDRAAAHPDITADHVYVDAAALHLVRAPWEYDVMVTENMFGDILSDLGAGLIGGMGMALSAALMLDWLADRHDDAAARQAAGVINSAVDQAYATADLLPFEHGGSHGTAEIRDQVLQQIDSLRLAP